ncbi:Histone-lysine N-methyltransferase set9 [Trapelia coarctata]|nr:Histone-lysine N-methyltransferase set9 [Trapelia coarctata]
MSTKDTMAKKDRLTLSQLASYDDILTDALVDHVYFWTTIRKNRSKYQLTRGISEDDVCHILLHEVIVSKDVQCAEYHLLRLPGLRKFVERLKTEREKEDFKRHMRKYISIWLPDCPWEVSTTNRYTIVTQEAAATARRFIKKGETIKYLCGNLVAMTSEEEKDLDLTRRDFSIVMSSRKKTPSLFLGPARFANHDCNANARLVTTGSEGMQVVAMRNIDVDEEITVTYGEDYFGIGNCECLCRTCELEVRNGWANEITGDKASGTTTPAVEQADESAGPYSFRNKRKYVPSSGTGSGLATPDTGDLRPAKRRKSGNSKMLSASQLFNLNLELTEGSEDLKREEQWDTYDSLPEGNVLNRVNELLSYQEPLILPPEEDSKEDILAEFDEVDLLAPSCGETLAVPTPTVHTDLEKLVSESLLESTASQTKIHTWASAYTLDDNQGNPREPPEKLVKMRKDLSQSSHISSDDDSIFSRDQLRSSSPASTPCRSDQDSGAWKPQTAGAPVEQELVSAIDTPAAAADSDSDLTDLSETEVFDDANLTIIRKPNPHSKSKAKPKSTPSSASLPPSTPLLRHPNDYIRTPLLLSEPFSRWVDCSTCPATWVQPNGYYTRKECPRCERHSKLYGYRWPKTEKVRGESVERVMDHRTVHRFVGPEEEKRVRRRGRGLVVEGAVGAVCGDGVVGSSVNGEESEEEEEENRGRRRGRRSRRGMEV